MKHKHTYFSQYLDIIGLVIYSVKMTKKKNKRNLHKTDTNLLQISSP